MNSMTGFGRGEARQEGATWVVECSSVNRKQLEVAVNLPRDLSDLETNVRNQVAAACSHTTTPRAVRWPSVPACGGGTAGVDTGATVSRRRDVCLQAT